MMGSKKSNINGKYYCGGPLGYRSECCNGYCGPETGCNCIECMRMDVESRGLPPKDGWLVNQDGKSAFFDNEKGFRCVDEKYGPVSKVYDPTVPYCNACQHLSRAFWRYNPLLFKS